MSIASAAIAATRTFVAGSCIAVALLQAAEPVPLHGDYEDPLHAQIIFGITSWQLAPWRAYLDTQPASRLLASVGVVGLGRKIDDYPRVARALALHGVVAVRLEVGWNSIGWDGAMKREPRERLTAALRACLDHGLRPLILLNAHHGDPGPTQSVEVTLAERASAGARSIRLDRLDRIADITPGWTGLQGQSGRAAFPLITSVNADGTCTLSAPLPRDLEAGKLRLTTLRYRPFAPPNGPDGKPDPASAETVAGWMAYVSEVCRTVREIVASGDPTDAGFDLEVWNELSFGSDFLDIQRYYNPKLPLDGKLTYEAHGRTRDGVEIILPMTVDWVNEPKNGMPGVRVISGFSSQRPWDSGVSAWPGQYGFSRHYYAELNPWGVSPRDIEQRQRRTAVGADGTLLGTPERSDWHAVEPGSYTYPAHVVRLPELWHFGYRTEFLTRDIQPFPSTASGPNSFAHHHRFAHPGTGRPPAVWMTETGVWRHPWGKELIAAGASKDDPAFTTVMQHIAAKALLRTTFMHAHKGVERVFTYAAQEQDDGFGILPDRLFKTWETGDAAVELGGCGLQLAALQRALEPFRDSAPIAVPRALTVDRILEHHPIQVFAGSGTPADPGRYHRDDLAVLPWQLGDGRFALAVWVVTRDVVHPWQPTAGLLDPARYDLPEQPFTITIGNIHGRRVQVRGIDPLRGTTVPIRHESGPANTVTLTLNVVDVPRVIVIDEAQAGPAFTHAAVVPTADAGAELHLTADRALRATITWGPLPGRVPSGWDATYLTAAGDEIVSSRVEGGIDHRWGRTPPVEGLTAEAFSARWEGIMTIPHAGTYRFAAAADGGVRLTIADQVVIDQWDGNRRQRNEGSAELAVGDHPILMEFVNTKGDANLRLEWAPPGKSFAPFPDRLVKPRNGKPMGGQTTVNLSAGVPAVVSIAELPVGFGVRASASVAGVNLVWPRWDHDVAGQVRFTVPDPLAAPGLERPVLPELPGRIARSATWKTMADDDGVRARWFRVTQAADALDQLPRWAPGDSHLVRVTTVHDVSAWRIDADATASNHPGLQHRAWSLVVIPDADGAGALLMSAPDRDTLVAAQTRVDALVSSIVIRE